MEDKDQISEIRRVNIMLLMDQLGITRSEFADKIGINRQTLSNAMQPDRTVSNKTCDKTYAAFPELVENSLDKEDGLAKRRKPQPVTIPSPRDVTVTFGFSSPISVEVPVDEARGIIIRLME